MTGTLDLERLVALGVDGLDEAADLSIVPSGSGSAGALVSAGPVVSAAALSARSKSSLVGGNEMVAEESHYLEPLDLL